MMEKLTITWAYPSKCRESILRLLTPSIKRYGTLAGKIVVILSWHGSPAGRGSLTRHWNWLTGRWNVISATIRHVTLELAFCGAWNARRKRCTKYTRLLTWIG